MCLRQLWWWWWWWLILSNETMFFRQNWGNKIFDTNLGFWVIFAPPPAFHPTPVVGEGGEFFTKISQNRFWVMKQCFLGKIRGKNFWPKFWFLGHFFAPPRLFIPPQGGGGGGGGGRKNDPKTQICVKKIFPLILPKKHSFITQNRFWIIFLKN